MIGNEADVLMRPPRTIGPKSGQAGFAQSPNALLEAKKPWCEHNQDASPLEENKQEQKLNFALDSSSESCHVLSTFRRDKALEIAANAVSPAMSIVLEMTAWD